MKQSYKKTGGRIYEQSNRNNKGELDHEHFPRVGDLAK